MNVIIFRCVSLLFIKYKGDKVIMKNTGTLNNKGFSLVELMIVVAIIGLLAAVGVPQYQKFQARARQGEAKASLSALYAAEQSFYGEWNQYSPDLRAIGFGVTGTGLRYVTGFSAGTCTNYSSLSGAPAIVATNIWSDSAGVCQNGAAQWGPPQTAACVVYFQKTLPAPTATNCVSTAGSAAFIGAAIGNPNNTMTGTAPPDGWTINNNKRIANTAAGIR